VAAAVGPRARVVSARTLRQTPFSHLHVVVVELRPAGRVERLVLRRFVSAAWVQDERDLAAREARHLEALAATAVPTPLLVAVDPDGSGCGVPAVLTRRLPGRERLAPPGRMDMDRWLGGLAAVLPVLHAVDPTVVRSRPYRPYYLDTDMRPPTWSRRPRMWERAIEVWRGPPPEDTPVFVHRDYHPGNVLWAAGRVTGVVDWEAASFGPVGVDLAHCRLNLATLFDGGVAERFLAKWRDAAGRPGYDLHPYWDLAAVLSWGPTPPTPAAATGPRHQLEAFLAAAIARLPD
jgi:aminoglycoside phosphotransferase (APT) family kinase protein